MASTASDYESGASKAFVVNFLEMLATHFLNEMTDLMASAHISVGPAPNRWIVQYPTPACT